MLQLDVIMAVPRLAGTMPDLDKADALLQEAAGHEDLPRLRPFAIHLADVLRLAAHIERIRRVHLHPVAQFEGLHARFELRVVLTAALMLGIQGSQKIELSKDMAFIVTPDLDFKLTATGDNFMTFYIVAEKMNDVSPIEVFSKAIENVKPFIEVRSKRVGGATYQVPTPVNSRRQRTLAIRWVLEAIRGKKGRPVHQNLAEELMNAYRREGAAMTKRDNVHRMADANKAFAHFAW